MFKRRIELVVPNTNPRMCMLIDPNSVGRTQLIQIDVEFNMKSILTVWFVSCEVRRFNRAKDLQ